MPINYNTLVKSEKGLHKLFSDYFKHILDMQNYLLVQTKQAKPISSAALRTMEAKEDKANKFEAIILDEAGWVLSKDNPRAAHMRFIVAITRAIKDLEIIGDFITKVTRYLHQTKNIDKKVKKIVVKVMQEAFYTTKRFYNHVASGNENTSKYYVKNATPLMKEFIESYRDSFKEMGQIIFKMKSVSDNSLKAFTVIKLVERSVAHAYNVLESFCYIKDPDFYFTKPSKK